MCLRLASEVGLGTASLATAVRIGHAYGSEVWGREAQQVLVLLYKCVN